MSKMTPQEMAQKIGSGLLSFPVTPFKADFSFDEKTYRSNMDWLCGYDVAGLFAAGGTGEFFSLTPAEVPAGREGRGRGDQGPRARAGRHRLRHRDRRARSRFPSRRPAPTACCCCRRI